MNFNFEQIFKTGFDVRIASAIYLYTSSSEIACIYMYNRVSNFQHIAMSITVMGVLSLNIR